MNVYRIGLIEWMENACTLKDFVINTMTDAEQEGVKKYCIFIPLQCLGYQTMCLVKES